VIGECRAVGEPLKHTDDGGSPACPPVGLAGDVHTPPGWKRDQRGRL